MELFVSDLDGTLLKIITLINGFSYTPLNNI